MAVEDRACVGEQQLGLGETGDARVRPADLRRDGGQLGAQLARGGAREGGGALRRRGCTGGPRAERLQGARHGLPIALQPVARARDEWRQRTTAAGGEQPEQLRRPLRGAHPQVHAEAEGQDSRGEEHPDRVRR